MVEYFLGIDPGSSGAIAVLHRNGDIADCCLLKKTEGDIAEFVRLLVLRGRCSATLESVHSMPAQGVKSTFTFGSNFGFLRGIIVAYQIPFTLVSPQRWQADLECRSAGDKNKTKAAAQRLWPTYKITHANADALLIAEYGRRHYWRTHESK